MKKLLERHKLQKLIKKEIEYLTRPITSKAIELVTLNYPQRKAQAQMCSLLKSAKYLRMPVLRFFQNKKEPTSQSMH